MDTVKISVKMWFLRIKPSPCRTLSNSKLLVHTLVEELLEENRLGWKMLPGRFLSKLLKVSTISETSNAKLHFTGVFEEFPCQHIPLLWRLYHRSWVGSQLPFFSFQHFLSFNLQVGFHPFSLFAKHLLRIYSEVGSDSCSLPWWSLDSAVWDYGRFLKSWFELMPIKTHHISIATSKKWQEVDQCNDNFMYIITCSYAPFR